VRAGVFVCVSMCMFCVCVCVVCACLYEKLKVDGWGAEWCSSCLGTMGKEDNKEGKGQRGQLQGGCTGVFQ